MARRLSLTKSQIKEEIIRCGKDPVYFLCNYAKISHPKKGEILFNTFDYQEDLLRKFRDYRYNIILKARQLGISTIVAGYIAWLINFYKYKEVLVIATKQQKAQNILRKVRTILTKMPSWLKLSDFANDNRTLIELENGSRCAAESTAGDAGRSDALSLLVIDEAAHIDNMDEIWTSIYPTVSVAGSVIGLSSPKGVGSWFHKTCVEAQTGENEFLLTELMWDVHPERDEAWFQKETKNFSEREIAQEYMCAFNASGHTVIDPKHIEKLKNNIQQPKYRTGFDRNYWIWKDYSPKNTYLVSADVARGDGEDYSTAVVLNLEDMEIVAEYKGKPSLDVFSSFLENTAKEYGGAMLVVENNNVGFTVASTIEEQGYRNLYYSKKGTHIYVDPIVALSDSTVIPGFTTTVKTRPLIIAKLEEYIRLNVLKSPSGRFIHELDTFVWNNGKPEAQRGYNDDLVMAMAIACWVRDTAIINSTREGEYKKALLNSFSVGRKILDTSIPGMHIGSIKESGRRLEKQFREQHNHQQQFPWLFVG